jgi:ribonuclease HI
MTTEYLCYTDGSCKAGENAPGGWGFHIKSPDGPPIEGHGHALRTQAKVMEYTAVAEALASIPHGARATVFSDNQALVQNLANNLEGWRSSQWAHVDPAIAGIVQRIDKLILDRRLTLTWQWLRGHNGNDGNERADALAAQGAREARAALATARAKEAPQDEPRRPYRSLKEALRDWRAKKAGASSRKRRK